MKYEFKKCVLRESQIWMPRRPKVPIVEERHMYCFIPHLTSSLSSFLLSSQDLNRDWGSEWRQRRTKKETWLAHREESDQRAQDRKVTQLTSPHNLEADCDLCLHVSSLSLAFFLSLGLGLSLDEAVGAVSVAVAGCPLGHLGNVHVPVGFCGYTESAGTHRYVKALLA